jgi:predicted Zn-dependent protease with MMP-like domain
LFKFNAPFRYNPRAMHVTDETFDNLISQAMAELPQRYIKGLDNVAIVYEDEPTPEQREKLRLRCNQTLFGLYEGIPRTKRNAGYNLVLPDKITLFKQPMLAASPTLAELKRQIKHTLWHEIAHHYGLDHARIHGLESK